MRTIHKHTLGLRAEPQRLKMPAGAKCLTFQMQHGVITGWFEVDDEIPNRDHWFKVVGTGHDVTYDDSEYIATVQDGAFVWHIYGLAL